MRINLSTRSGNHFRKRHSKVSTVIVPQHAELLPVEVASGDGIQHLGSIQPLVESHARWAVRVTAAIEFEKENAVSL